MSTDRAPLLEVQQPLARVRRAIRCLDGLDLVVGEGEIVSVIGPNGAGKTTLFNVITGVYPPDERRHPASRGESVVGLDPHRIAQRGIARTFQTLRLFLNMTVKENVMAAAYGHTKAGVVALRPAHARHAARGARDRAARGGAARLLRRPPRRLPLEPARLQPLVREPPPARDRARDRREAEASPPRRAGGRDEPSRDARDHRAHRPAARRGRVHDPRHRARHARRRGDLRPRRCARPRREDRGGLVRRRSRPIRGSSRRTSGRREADRK